MYAARSQRLACEVNKEGRFDEEIIPTNNDKETVTEDEGLRPETTVEKLAELPTVFAEDGTITLNNASRISDGAAAVMVISCEFADDYGLDILASVGTHSIVGVNPEIIGIGPVPAVRNLMDCAGTRINDYGLVEFNKAPAS